MPMTRRRRLLAACHRLGAAAALLFAPVGLSAQPPQAMPAQTQSQAVNSPILGRHTLLAQSEGLGASPAITEPVDTQPVGSTLLVFNGGYSSNDADPTDNYGNRWKALGPAVPYGNGYGDRFDVKAYIALAAKGGARHTVSIVKRGDAVGEISIPFIEIRQAGVLKDVSQTYAPAGLTLHSGSVKTSGPAILIAVWWGDGGVKRMTAVPNNGFTVIDSFLKLPDNSGVQCAVAFKRVDAAGTYDVSWIGAPIQGAILWLFAFQSAH
jgi:hypothetical protein